jgi:tetratricopeptide (TPR) repeat protein
MTDPETFARVDALIDVALDLPPEQREAWLRDQCGADEPLLQAAQAMLAAMDASEGFLDVDAAVSTPPIPPTLGVWQPERLIGRGGMGEVWLARRCDGRFEQEVAIKLLPAFCDHADVERFVAEQRTLASLEHPGIARLIDAGLAPDQRPYMVMEYVDGIDIVSHCRQHALPLERRLELFRQVCTAVAFAHRHLIVHRDLKPQNILVHRDGRVVLLDFGIARLLDKTSGQLAQDTRARFTPHYAAPEQLTGGPESTLTDVHALGVVLYEMVTGKNPWNTLVGGKQMILLQRAVADPPAAASSVADDPAVPPRLLRGDVDAIIDKALRPEPTARYESVRALEQDINRHLNHHAVSARGGALGYRLRRTLRRYWLPMAATASIILGLTIALVLVGMAQRQTERERDIARMEAARGKAVRDYLGHMFRDASRHQADGTALTAKQVLDQAAARISDEFAREPAIAAQVMQELGELHLYIDDYVGAEPLLRGWLELEDTVQDPVTAANVRFALAETVFRMGQVEEAQSLLDLAQAFWLGDRHRHVDDLLNSRMLQSQLQRARRDDQGAIATLEAAVAETLQRHGTASFRTAALHTNLGAAYLAAGDLEAGIERSRQALALWERIELGSSNDALNTLNNIAAGYYRAGDLETAEHWFGRAVAVRREAFGPSAATAALLNNYARVLLQTGRLDLAARLAAEATAMAATYAGERSVQTLSARLLAAEIALAERSGATAELAASLEQLQEDVDSQFGGDHLLSARVALARSRYLALAGDHREAAQQLLRTRAQLDALGAQGAQFVAQADAIGELIGDGDAEPATTD